MTCHECRETTTAVESRRVWLKDQGTERRLCKTCLKARGLQLVPRHWSRKP